MFNAPFSFNGRIKRTEFAISLFIGFCIYLFVGFITSNNKMNPGLAIVTLSISIPLYWFLFAQGAKRSHDVNKSGWLQLIPFYWFYLIFAEGEMIANIYGDSPKTNSVNVSSFSGNSNKISNNGTKASNQTTYTAGNYTGGHNKPNATLDDLKQNNENIQNKWGYKSGELYK